MASENDKGGEGQGGGVSKADVDARVAAEVKAALAQGSVEAVLDRALRRAHDLERKLAETEKRLPAEGSVVLDRDAAKRYEAYQGLGDPSDLRKAVAERDTFRAENEKHARTAKIREAADLHYPGKARVLEKLLDGVDFDFAEVPGKDGKKARAAVLKPEKEGDKPVALTELIESQHAEFLPALRGSGPQAQPHGTPPRGGPGNPPTPASDDSEYLAQRQTGRYSLV